MSTRALYSWLAALVVALIAAPALFLAYKHYFAASAPAADDGALHVEEVTTPEQTGRAQFLEQLSTSTNNPAAQTARAQFLQSASQATTSANAQSGPTQEDRAKFLESLKK